MMCLTQRENSYYHVTKMWMRYILHIVGDFGININDVENNNIFGLQRQHLITVMDYSVCTK